MEIRTIDSSGQDVLIENFPDARGEELHDSICQLAPKLGFRARDAEPVSHIVGQLAYLEAEAQTKEYEPRKYQELLGECITGEAGEWAETVLYRIKDRTGKGKRIHPRASNMPMADVAKSQSSITVAHGGIGYAYFLQELRAAAKFGTPLAADRQEAAVEGYLDHLDDVALLGEAESNFLGLLSYTGVTANNRPSGAVWDAAAADAIRADINALLGNVYSTSKTRHPPSHLVLPPSRIPLLMAPRATGSDLTIYEWIVNNNLYASMSGKPLTIVAGPAQMDTLGAGSTKRAMAFTPKKGNLKFHVPMPQRFLAPQAEGLEVAVFSEYRYGGLDFSKKYTAEYMDGL